MGRVRGHEPVVIEEINGLWSRGDDESCPKDHLLLANNIQFIHSGIETRQATKPYAQVVFTSDLRQTVRVHNYNSQWGQSLIVMVEGGIFYHVVSATEIYQILSVPWATDFAMIVIAGRAYISPFKTHVTQTEDPQVYALPIPNSYVYVYGDNKKPNPLVGILNARPAAGDPPTNASGTPSDGGKKQLIVYVSSAEGKVTKGIHSVSVAFNNGQLGMVALVDAPGDKAIELINIPIGPAGMGVTSRTIHMSKAAPNNQNPYSNPWYAVVTIADNTTTTYRFNTPDEEFPGVSSPTATPPAPVSGALVVFQDQTEGFCDLGFHLIAVVYETDTGYLTAPGPEYFGGATYVNEKKAVKISSIPTSTDYFVKKRHIVSTKWIPEYNGDQKGYQFFFVPKGTLENNTATEITVSYYDSDLIADASHLIDNFAKIPAGVNFCEYHGRMVVVADANFPKKVDGTADTAKSDNRSVAWVSAPGEPEAISQVDGLIVTPLDGTPLTNCKTFRDVLYLFKQNRTFSVVDNQDEPTTWGPVEVLDQGIGAPVHGIAEVLDSGGVNIDYLIIGDWSGLMLFNGTYARPELSWKIENIWMNWNKNLFHKLQVINDSIRKKLWILPPIDLIVDEGSPGVIYLADYGNGLNPKDIRWAKWDFQSANITSLALVRTDLIVMSTWQPDDPFNP